MAFSDQRKSAFDYASEVTKQLVTLATGIIALSITVSTDVIATPNDDREWLIGAWIAYLISIIFGIWTLMALTGELQPSSTTDRDPSTRGGNVTGPAILQILLFLGATLALVVYAIKTFDAKALPAAK
jgi:hypothetical protein